MGLRWPDIETLIDQHPDLVFLFVWVLIMVAIAVSAVIRARRGKPVFARAPADAIFVERRASGRSLRSVITRMGGARSVLFVTVTPDQLSVRPHFPFSLMFLPQVYGLDWQVTRSQLRKVTEEQDVFGRRVIVEFALPSRGERFELRLSDPEGFMRAIKVMRQGAV